jgi:alkyl sulfatase BDS1-like metallo-beta-lactamase superfamily hydrolase
MTNKYLFLITIIIMPCVALAQQDLRKDAAASTRDANATVVRELPFSDTEDFALADRGLIARPETIEIRDEAGNVVWDLGQFAFASDAPPASVNPSLWRQAQLNSRYGLYEVTERIYQLRGFDISNITIIESDSGYIVIDPLLTAETARAAMQFAFEHLPRKPIVAVIYSHSHADHFGGVKGVISQQDVDQGKVRVVASDGFMDYAVSENILAGNVMTRRASYMFGSLLPKDERGGIGAGLGNAISTGEVTLIAPTELVMETGQELVIDGVRMVFMNTPFAEAPAEMMFYLPQMKAFFAAEEANGTLHNLYTMRGAQVRDALLWSQYLHEAIDLLPEDTDTLFGSHHWPRWGYDNIVDYLGKQGDAYRYIHDQTLRLANHGYTPDEISEQLELPPELGQVWYNRGYYGTVSHNARAVYQKYLGYFDGNPANMHPLPPEDAAARYVDFMGGADAVLDKARGAYDEGDFRWVAEVVNHVVFADPDNTDAKRLQADALEQLGYQAESGQWRNFYLTAASELRNGITRGDSVRTERADMINALTLSELFNALAVRLNGPAAAGKHTVINFHFSDSDSDYRVTLANGVLNHAVAKRAPDADVNVELTRRGFLGMAMAGVPVESLIESQAIQVDGDVAALVELIGLLDSFEFWFNIVTP